MGAAVYRPATLDDAMRLFELRRSSILELALSGMSVEDATAWAKQLTLSGMERKLRELEIWVAELDGIDRRMGRHSRRHAGGTVHRTRICRAGRRRGVARSARRADAWTGGPCGSCGGKFERPGFLSSTRLQADRSANAGRGLAHRKATSDLKSGLREAMKRYAPWDAARILAVF